MKLKTYENLHQYMDAIFYNSNPTDTEIKQAKEQWRKIYLENYRKTYRHNKVQISFMISKKQYKAFELVAKEKQIKVTTLLKQCALTKGVQTDFAPFKRQLFDLIDTIEEAIAYKQQVSLDDILIQLESLEKKLDDC